MSTETGASIELQALLSGRCVYCGRAAEGNFSVHRDGMGVGPVVPLCDACGSNYEPTLYQIWARIAEKNV